MLELLSANPVLVMTVVIIDKTHILYVMKWAEGLALPSEGTVSLQTLETKNLR